MRGQARRGANAQVVSDTGVVVTPYQPVRTAVVSLRLVAREPVQPRVADHVRAVRLVGVAQAKRGSAVARSPHKLADSKTRGRPGLEVVGPER